MNHGVHESMPDGSVILAYGTSKQREPRWKRWVIICSFLGAILVALIMIALLMIRIPLPQNRLLLVALRPSEIHHRITVSERLALPPPWRSAIESKSRTPVLLGVFIQDGSLEPYAVVSRDHVIDAESGLVIQDYGAMHLLSSSGIREQEEVTAMHLLSLWVTSYRHDAGWELDADALHAFALDLPSDSNALIHGTWDGSRGVIELSSNRKENLDVPKTPFVVVLSRTRNEAMPVLDALTSQGIDLRSIEASPNIIAIDEGGDIHALWNAALSEEDAMIALGAFGETKKEDITLPDHTTLPIFTTSGTTLERLTKPTEPLFLSTSGSLTPSSQQIEDTNCSGTLRFRLEGQYLINILRHWNIPIEWLNHFHSIEIREQTHHSILCINE